VGVCAAVLFCSCSVAVSVGSFNLVKEQQYDVRWNTGWTNVARDSKPLQTTSTSPGVCNAGGSKQGCYDADAKLIADYTALAKALSGSIVPSEFVKANDTVHQGIAADIRGLTERDTLIATQNANGTFEQSNQSLEQAQSLFKSSIGEFKGPNRPENPFS
jgi:hypothetical protein